MRWLLVKLISRAFESYHNAIRMLGRARVESSAAGRRLPWATKCASQERDAWLRGLDSTLFLIRHVRSQDGAASAAWLWRSFPPVHSCGLVLRLWLAGGPRCMHYRGSCSRDGVVNDAER
jgi:hypothetical protein